MAEKIKVEDQLRLAVEHADRLAGVRAQFLANMSHELRTPLNAIIGFSSAIVDTKLGEDEKFTRRSVEHIYDAGELLLDLVNNILDLTQIDSGTIPIKLDWFDLNELVEDIGKTLSPLIVKNCNSFFFTSVTGGLRIHTDQGRLRQVFVNLIANSAKFTKDGIIEVAIWPEPDKRVIRIQVTDSGAGIPPELLPEVFKPYVQGDAHKANFEKGSGLGLMIVRSICDSMEWDISVESKLQEGTCFSLSIPLTNKTADKQIDKSAHVVVDRGQSR